MCDGVHRAKMTQSELLKFFSQRSNFFVTKKKKKKRYVLKLYLISLIKILKYDIYTPGVAVYFTSLFQDNKVFFVTQLII